MTLANVLCAFIAAVAAIISAVVSTTNTIRHKEAEKRAELRSREGRLMMDMIHANMQLSIGTAMAIKNGKANGEMKEGLEAVSECDRKYSDFLQEVTSSELSKF